MTSSSMALVCPYLVIARARRGFAAGDSVCCIPGSLYHRLYLKHICAALHADKFLVLYRDANVLDMVKLCLHHIVCFHKWPESHLYFFQMEDSLGLMSARKRYRLVKCCECAHNPN